eukprot:scaffold2857_cov399-Prasinococcus_capsulatus_cf.AAC.9
MSLHHSCPIGSNKACSLRPAGAQAIRAPLGEQQTAPTPRRQRGSCGEMGEVFLRARLREAALDIPRERP